jgi:alpha-glucuronidase
MIKVIKFYIFLVGLFCSLLHADDGYDLWLKYGQLDDQKRLTEYRRAFTSIIVEGHNETRQIIKQELFRSLTGLLQSEFSVTDIEIQTGSILVGTPDHSGRIKNLIDSSALDTLGVDGFIIRWVENNSRRFLLITANSETGLLYGAFHFLRLIQTCTDLGGLNVVEKPRIRFRLLDHWNNLDGSVERGYAGRSLWNWQELPAKIDSRYADYARANASLGINGTVLNNVNATPEILTRTYLEKIAALAAVLRPYGIKTYLSINFSSPLSPVLAADNPDGSKPLDTADPLNPEVRKWWIDKVKEIYSFIPDFGGFLVKANSEGMPGPQDYNRTHVDGANMLAEALAPYHGILMWRAFVYNPDVDEDRAKRAFKEFVPLDGQFQSNVFVQAKNGPIDFQPREPVQPLFGAMPHTPLMLELQITQEYLGHSTHLVYLAPMWQEYLHFDTYAYGKGSSVARIIDGSLQKMPMTGIAGVSNIGADRNWCGHLFGQANWYAFGRLAWDPYLSADEIADEWVRMTFGSQEPVLQTIRSMMMGSWEACVNYMTPLGLHHIMQAGFHYGPAPENAQGRLDWRSVYYHRADRDGLGYDRSSSGSNAIGQYFPPVRELFDNLDTCPEKYLLWFHHVRWDHPMKSGRTLWDELCRKYNEGVQYVGEMQVKWDSIKDSVDPEIYAHVAGKLRQQKEDAGKWRDTCIRYFQGFSQMAVPVE